MREISQAWAYRVLLNKPPLDVNKLFIGFNGSYIGFIGSCIDLTGSCILVPLVCAPLSLARRQQLQHMVRRDS